jgi:hypothetical protein
MTAQPVASGGLVGAATVHLQCRLTQSTKPTLYPWSTHSFRMHAYMVPARCSNRGLPSLSDTSAPCTSARSSCPGVSTGTCHVRLWMFLVRLGATLPFHRGRPGRLTAQDRRTRSKSTYRRSTARSPPEAPRAATAATGTWCASENTALSTRRRPTRRGRPGPCRVGRSGSSSAPAASGRSVGSVGPDPGSPLSTLLAPDAGEFQDRSFPDSRP